MSAIVPLRGWMYAATQSTTTTTYTMYVLPSLRALLPTRLFAAAALLTRALPVSIIVATTACISVSFFLERHPHHVRQQGRPFALHPSVPSAAVSVCSDCISLTHINRPAVLVCVQLTRTVRPTIRQAGQVRRFADITSPDAPIAAAGVSTEPGTSANPFTAQHSALMHPLSISRN